MTIQNQINSLSQQANDLKDGIFNLAQSTGNSKADQSLQDTYFLMLTVLRQLRDASDAIASSAK